jgi:hypothetical protein
VRKPAAKLVGLFLYDSSPANLTKFLAASRA